MFKYTLQPSSQALLVDLPDKLQFSYDFLKSASSLFWQIDNVPCSQVNFRCKPGSSYDKLSKAYLYNIFSQVAKKKTVFWNNTLKAMITSTVHSQKGTDFIPVNDLFETISSTELNLYRFGGDDGISFAVNELTRIMVDKNLALNPSKIKEFLSTTIGEIFSNSINHSEQDVTYFMFDVIYEDDRFMLYVNIIDYGTTIVENVRSYVNRTQNRFINSKDCILWAIERGNTTRDSSGGYGLPTLIEYIAVVHGDLFIFSGDACFRLEDGIMETNELTSSLFAGTSVTFKVELLKTSNVLKYDPLEKKLTYISLDNI